MLLACASLLHDELKSDLQPINLFREAISPSKAQVSEAQRRNIRAVESDVGRKAQAFGYLPFNLIFALVESLLVLRTVDELVPSWQMDRFNGSWDGNRVRLLVQSLDSDRLLTKKLTDDGQAALTL